jgi:predicted nucleic acid-binding protein
MKEFFDTSVLVAAFRGDHVRHAASIRLLSSAATDKSACGVHTLAEVYAVMTALPVKPPIQPEQALRFIGEIENRLTTVALDGNEYKVVIEDAAGKGLSGGKIYDALLLRCAIKWHADVIYTWNVKHFQNISPEIHSRIQTPQ